ncbi:Patatin-like phospholipase [Singulisphaera sp. GP187]|uniref:patatin-like phospholipase family protein n=1 Tax=Singulisphaera sp. GP187 TaxID=1882752 RepID=UPI00092C516A|nr:patatin-like phospholipase family protein [Singulisphaera sp. GP187]SIO28094.1 Patatin-like phospholipase [Singulisphaera sp. GP187]
MTRRDAMKISAAQLSLACALPAASRAFGAPRSGGVLDVVFEGGGIKGAALAGAARVLSDNGFSYRRMIGSSAGAISATLLAAGYQPKRLLEILTERTPQGQHRFNQFLAPPEEIAPPPFTRTTGTLSAGDKFFAMMLPGAWSLFTASIMKACKLLEPVGKFNPKFSEENMKLYVGHGLSLLSNGAVATDKAFTDWMGERLEELKLSKNITLGEFHRVSLARGIQLSVVATDVTAKKSLVLNHHTAPGVPLVSAVRMSMGIPLVWPEVEWSPSWGPYRGKPMWDENNAGHRVVDGGVLSNFPLKYLLDDRQRAATGVLGPFRDDTSTRTLGLLLDETLDIPGVPQQEEKEKMADKMPAYQSMSRLMATMQGAWDQEAIDESPAGTILCRIPVKGYDTLDFDMSEGRMKVLVASGTEAMANALKAAGLAT